MSKNPPVSTPRETAACCCVDVGTLIDNRDCRALYQQSFSCHDSARAALDALTARARALESDPCEIVSALHQQGAEVQLSAEFTFCCQAEAMIFQLALR